MLYHKLVLTYSQGIEIFQNASDHGKIKNNDQTLAPTRRQIQRLSHRGLLKYRDTVNRKSILEILKHFYY